MLTRFALLAVLMAFNVPGCKKSPATAADAAQTPTPKSATTAAAPVATPIPTPAKPAIDQSAQVIIYGYHRFVKQVRRPDTEITPENFEAQMKMLKDKNIPVIGMQDFLAWKRGEKNIPPHAAIITIDDGYKSGYEVAWPILKKYGYPVTMFVYTEGIKPGKYSGGESMSWEQLAEMRDAGADIQSHTQTHQDLRKPPYDRLAKHRLGKDEYEPWLENEIAGAKQIIEQKLGVKVNCFAVPYGFYNEHVKEVAMKAGYEALFTVYGQKLSYSSPMDSLGRYMIEGNKPKVFTEAADFGGSTGSGAPAVAEISKTEIGAQPADGDTITTALPLIRANLSSFGQLDEKSVQMRVSGLGLVPSSFDPKTQTVSYQVTQKLRDKSCTVIVSGKAGEKKVETKWSFNISDGSAPATASPAPVKR